MNDFLVESFGDRNICIKGIGKLFYEQGFPISMSISELKKHNIEVSIFHVADECFKNGWNSKTVFNKLKADFEDDIQNNYLNVDELKRFCYSDYETQREMIHQYLFKDIDSINWLKTKI
jgi:hypothetical protein